MVLGPSFKVINLVGILLAVLASLGATSMIIINQKMSPFKITLIKNTENGGYGYNQKIGYFYSIKNDFDFVAMLHGDGQYEPILINKFKKFLISNCAMVQGYRSKKIYRLN